MHHGVVVDAACGTEELKDEVRINFQLRSYWRLGSSGILKRLNVARSFTELQLQLRSQDRVVRHAIWQWQNVHPRR